MLWRYAQQNSARTASIWLYVVVSVRADTDEEDEVFVGERKSY